MTLGIVRPPASGAATVWPIGFWEETSNVAVRGTPKKGAIATNRDPNATARYAAASLSDFGPSRRTGNHAFSGVGRSEFLGQGPGWVVCSGLALAMTPLADQTSKPLPPASDTGRCRNPSGMTAHAKRAGFRGRLLNSWPRLKQQESTQDLSSVRNGDFRRRIAESRWSRFGPIWPENSRY